MKKIAILTLALMLFTGISAHAMVKIEVKLMLDGIETEVDSITAIYKKEDGTYSSPQPVTKPGKALVFVKKTVNNEVWAISKEMDLEIGDNIIDFKSTDLDMKEIHIGEQVYPMENSVFVDFENLPAKMELELKIKSGNTLKINLSKNLKVHTVYFNDVLGRTGINISQKDDFDFVGNYYAKAKVDYAVMLDRPSFQELFDICDANDNPINELFFLGDGGGCNYKYFKDGKVVLEGKFGDISNGLHFENLSEGIYDMEFSFNDGDLVVMVQDIMLVNQKPDNSIVNNKKSLEIIVEHLPISGSDIDIHELMKREEDKIVFIIQENKFLDGNILNQNDIELFNQNNKTFSINTDFIEVEFNKELINEMVKTNKDLSMHIKNGLSHYSKEEAELFLDDNYKVMDNLKFVCDYEVKIYLTEYDLIAGEFPQRPIITFKPYKEYLQGKDFRKISVFTDIQNDNTLELLSGKNRNNCITVELTNPIPNYYFNLYEQNITFSDVNSSWAKDYIEVMASRGIINGTGNGLYKSKDKLTKAQFITLLIKALNSETEDYKGIYKDCRENDWFTPFVEKAYQLGIVNLPINREFKANTEISRLEMTIMAVKAYENYTKSSFVPTDIKSFNDVSSLSKEDLNYIIKAVELEIISGMPDGTFRPYESLNREQAAKIIYQLLSLLN
ncbi:S-layer homology domain-containing protein [Vallitalea maricola]|uniref:Uncharacterized protein n=1 Tax=Vallitalea maricola TaxID=3074433 RepID=A0ACB5UHP0_9FIRM|nr:hypothetical protein AN2V17_06520 [Vallitalea sp. AN17-2]